ncbi:unnamed protein product [Bursaphelenchus xylophilus]|uniref:(pine wood nematode) hypothetical protein n=1 Tax=Bursaphelenchus xylophilus TaxID=6326 RepID=A0A1I7SE40_BURXY|nr:unnamed protein product [Bursaphelenchus xylophilus]CAG9104223.1 unnamed protein product [Bursaphelenchus xylophilus]
MFSKFLIVCLLGSALAEVFRIGLTKEFKRSKEAKVAGHDRGLNYAALDHVYTGIVSLGTPLQDVNVAFDTESGVFWVPDDECPCDAECSNEPFCRDICSTHCCSRGGGNSTSAGSEDGQPAPVGVCTHKNVYDPKKSSSYIGRRVSTAEPFLNENITVNLAYETFRLVPHRADSVSIKYFQFGHVNDLPEAFEDVPYDGVFGLGRVGPKRTKAPIKQLFERRVIPNAVVTLSLKDGHTPNQVYDGVITFGKIDETFCNLSSAHFVPVASTNKWNFNVNTAALNATILSDLTWTARVNPSSPFIHIPIKIWDGIKSQLIHDVENDRYTARCSVLKNKLFSNFHIEIGSRKNNVMAKQIIIERGSELCELLVRPAAENDDHWILGLPFFSERCVALDYNGKIAVSDFK